MTELIVDDVAPDKTGRPRRLLPAWPPGGRDQPPKPKSEPDRSAAIWGDTRSADAVPHDDNRLTPYDPAILAVRWATTGVSVALASPAVLDVEPAVTTWVLLVAGHTVFRTIRPLRYDGSLRAKAFLLVEIGFHVLAVVTTGHWSSALVLLMINAVIVAGFARSFRFAIMVALASAAVVSLDGIRVETWGTDEAAQAARWTTLLLSGGIIAGYTRRISGEASRRHSLALDRVARLADANALLTNLHRVAQTLPASLDLADVLESSLSRLRGLVGYDAAVILIREEAGGTWSVAAQRALALSDDVTLEAMPRPARRAIDGPKLVRLDRAEEPNRAFGDQSQSAIYQPLLARGQLIGLLGIEARAPELFTARDEQVLRGFVEPVALAIDNARWFDRIRNVAADDERNRIARDLHDRIGQSLAYLGFEIDRMIRKAESGEPVGDGLVGLRGDLGEVIGEVRDTLSDLRTDVTDSADFAQTAAAFGARVGQRSDLTITLDCDTEHRLPILQEREMWRIAQEAMVNVERHAEATEATVVWRCDPDGALLEVTDDGRGLPARSADGRLGRPDSYGILGMRERAESVGASFELISQPGEGTKVRCYLPQT